MNDVAKATARAEDVCGEQLEPLETLRLETSIGDRTKFNVVRTFKFKCQSYHENPRSKIVLRQWLKLMHLRVT